MEECRDLRKFHRCYAVSLAIWFIVEGRLLMRHTMNYVVELILIHITMFPRTHRFFIDLYWARLDFCQSFQGSWHLYRGCS
jgi:hypothetical protein